MWKKAPKAEGIASVNIDTVAQNPRTRFIRWKVHGDWVQQVCTVVTWITSSVKLTIILYSQTKIAYEFADYLRLNSVVQFW